MIMPVERDDASIMRYVVALAWRNVREQTGGPFAAMIIDNDTGHVVSHGVNLVTSANCSVLHAEIIAIIIASERRKAWNLSEGGSVTLFTSSEPCAMCLGAIPWSGIQRVVVAARDEDVRASGFDEGAKPDKWVEKFSQRGISVVRDVEREAALEVLAYYAQHGGIIYG